MDERAEFEKQYECRDYILTDSLSRKEFAEYWWKAARATVTEREKALVEALEGIRSLFAGDPKGEYVVARADGEPLCLADQMIIGSRFVDKAEAALARYQQETGK